MIEATVKWFFAVVVCLILQSTIVPIISIFGIQPDLIILVFFFMCLKQGVMVGVLVGFIFGLGMDAYSPAMLGQNALAKTVIGFMMGFFNERVMRTDPVLKIIILLIAFFLHDSIFFGAELIKNGNSLLILFHELLTYTLPRTVYTIVIALLVQFWSSFIQPNLKR